MIKAAPSALGVLLLLSLEFFLPASQGGIWDLPLPRLVSWELELIVLGILGGLSGFFGLRLGSPGQTFLHLWAWAAFLPLLVVTILIPMPFTRTLEALPFFLVLASGLVNGGLMVLRDRRNGFPRNSAAAASYLPSLILLLFAFWAGGEGKSGAAGVLILALILLGTFFWLMEDRRGRRDPVDSPGGLVPEALVHFRISEREADVARLTAQGLTNQEIAQALFISLATVKSHLASLFLKTSTKNRTQMVARLSNPPFGR